MISMATTSNLPKANKRFNSLNDLSFLKKPKKQKKTEQRIELDFTWAIFILLSKTKNIWKKKVFNKIIKYSQKKSTSSFFIIIIIKYEKSNDVLSFSLNFSKTILV